MRYHLFLNPIWFLHNRSLDRFAQNLLYGDDNVNVILSTRFVLLENMLYKQDIPIKDYLVNISDKSIWLNFSSALFRKKKEHDFQNSWKMMNHCKHIDSNLISQHLKQAIVEVQFQKISFINLGRIMMAFFCTFFCQYKHLNNSHVSLI